MQVFISYNWKDQALAVRVAQVLRDEGFQVWNDSEILPGENPGEAVARALCDSDAMVVLLTPNSVQSPQLRNELGYALGEERYRGRVIPVYAVPPELLAEAPWILKRFQGVKLANKSRLALGKIAQVLKSAPQPA